MDGPYTGIVVAITDNSYMIENRQEGKDHRSSINSTGGLRVIADDTLYEEIPAIIHCKLLRDLKELTKYKG